MSAAMRDRQTLCGQAIRTIDGSVILTSSPL